MKPVYIEKAPMSKIMYLNKRIILWPRRLYSVTLPSAEADFDHFKEVFIGAQLSLLPDHKGGDKEHDESVSHISKHNPKEKGKGNDREQRRVHLAIVRHAVRIHNGLKSFGELISAKVCWRRHLCLDAVQD